MTMTYVVERRSDKQRLLGKVVRRGFARDEQARDRLRLEWQAVREVRHENVVKAHDFAPLSDGRDLLVLELLAGVTLEQEMARRTIDIAEAALWTREMLAGLRAAHRVKVLHRDLHPGNVFLHDAGGGRRVVKLIDFGFAKPLLGARVDRVFPETGDAVLLGVVRFASPEALKAEPLDERSDVYSAGLVLYSMLTGDGPFPELERTSELLVARLRQPLRPLSELRPDVPRALERIVHKALMSRPLDRYPTAGHFRRALGRLQLPGGWAYTRSFTR
jgi:serine/threonine-protein kinase